MNFTNVMKFYSQRFLSKSFALLKKLLYFLDESDQMLTKRATAILFVNTSHTLKHLCQDFLIQPLRRKG